MMKFMKVKMYYYTPIVIDVISQKIDSATNKLVGIGAVSYTHLTLPTIA